MSASPLVRLEEISKAFPGVLANDRVTLEVTAGEIHALVGENGAGKTTLMRILCGLERPDGGRIYWQGRPVEISSPQEAIRLGIGMVHQRFQLVPSLTVAENVALGREPRRGPVFDRSRAAVEVQDLAVRTGLRVDPRATVADLSVGVQQRVEILRVLLRRPRLLILDEPTTVLTPQETTDLFAVLRRLAAEGTTILFITHKLPEVFAISSRVTVLRRGRVVGTLRTAEAAPEALARMIVGEALPARRDAREEPPGVPVLRVENLRVRDDRGAQVLDGVTLEVRRGEILGVAGVEGNGQKELVEVIAGVRPLETGRVLLGEDDVTFAPVRARRAAGLAVIPEDRYLQGVSLPMTVEENLLATRYPSFVRRGLLEAGRIRSWALAVMGQFDIRAPHPAAAARTLSGGNLQRVVVARELASAPVVLVASHPSRGLDLAATRFVHDQLRALRDRGGGVLLVSADLDEILELADRIAVIFAGRIVAHLPAAGASRERLGLLMAGKAA